MPTRPNVPVGALALEEGQGRAAGRREPLAQGRTAKKDQRKLVNPRGGDCSGWYTSGCSTAKSGMLPTSLASRAFPFSQALPLRLV